MDFAATTKDSSVKDTAHQSISSNTHTLDIPQHYHRPYIVKSLLQVVFTSLGCVLTCVIGTYLAYTGNYLLSLFLLLPAALFIVRTFILLHDCGHNSLFNNRQQNIWVGRFLGLLTLTPFTCWKRFHNTHHISSGNLDKRGLGDVITWTVYEYRHKSTWVRFLYRVYRHPFILFGIGPFIIFVIRQRLTYYLPLSWRKERFSIHLTSATLAALCLLLWWTGYLWSYLVFFLPAMALASSIGVWLFYIQHQFPAAYWRRDNEWSFVDSALLGSTFYDLPQFFHWVTAYIGFHHIHHLNTKIPNYRLPECYREIELPRSPVTVTIIESIQYAKLKLWDEQRNVYVGFSDI